MSHADNHGFDARFEPTSEGEPWPPLDPLPEEVDHPPEPFPLDGLGPILSAAAGAIARDVQAPPAMAGAAVLATAALAAQPLVNVMLPHGSAVPTSLYVVTAAASGDRKSSVDKVAMHQVECITKAMARDYAVALAKHKAAVEEMVATKGKGKAKEPAPPPPQSLVVGNATVEGIQSLLAHQSSIGLFTTEGAEFLAGYSMQQDRKASSYAVLLKLWDGALATSMRATTGMSVLLDRRLSTHLLVQPMIAHKLMADPLARGQGVLARCLIAQPESLAGTRLYREVDPNKAPELKPYHERMHHLLATTPKVHAFGDGLELMPELMTLAGVSRKTWIHFHDLIEGQIGPEGEFRAAAAFATRLPEQAARIAAIVTLVEDPAARAIPLSIMQGACSVANFYLSEHTRLTNTGAQEREFGLLGKLLWWMQSAAKAGRVVHKHILQGAPNEVRDLKAAGINPLLDELARRGYIRRVGPTWEVRRV